METEDMVKVKANARKSTDGTLWVFDLICPFCDKRHVHGAGVVATAKDEPDAGYFGERSAHCDPTKKYEIVP